jgi:hypothetical protein
MTEEGYSAQSPSTSDAYISGHGSPSRDSLDNTRIRTSCNDGLPIILRYEPNIDDSTSSRTSDGVAESSNGSRPALQRRVSGPRPMPRRVSLPPENVEPPYVIDVIPPYQEFEFSNSFDVPEPGPVSASRNVAQRSRVPAVDVSNPRPQGSTVEVEDSDQIPSTRSGAAPHSRPERPVGSRSVPRAQRRQTVQIAREPLLSSNPQLRSPPLAQPSRSLASLSAKQRRSSSLGAYLDYKLQHPDPGPDTSQSSTPRIGHSAERDRNQQGIVYEVVAAPISVNEPNAAFISLPTIEELPKSYETAQQWHTSVRPRTYCSMSHLFELLPIFSERLQIGNL